MVVVVTSRGGELTDRASPGSWASMLPPPPYLGPTLHVEPGRSAGREPRIVRVGENECGWGGGGGRGGISISSILGMPSGRKVIIGYGTLPGILGNGRGRDTTESTGYSRHKLDRMTGCTEMM